jgi:hypothetical protein
MNTDDSLEVDPASGVADLVAPEVAPPKPENNALQARSQTHQTVTSTLRLSDTHMDQRHHPFSLSWALKRPSQSLLVGHRGRKLVEWLMGYDMNVGIKRTTIVTY